MNDTHEEGFDLHGIHFELPLIHIKSGRKYWACRAIAVNANNEVIAGQTRLVLYSDKTHIFTRGVEEFHEKFEGARFTV